MVDYKPNPARRGVNTKRNKKHKILTVVDRVIQQAIARELMPIYEE